MADTHSTLALLVGTRLAARRWKLVTAESCTGGMVAAAMTDIAGSSEWFERGYVTYSNEAKSELLGVPPLTLIQYGAVSPETAQAMATGALQASHARIAVSITGIAGPGGAVPGKPVGTVCFGWAVFDPERTGISSHTDTETRLFEGDRAAVRRQATQHALQGVLARLE